MTERSGGMDSGADRDDDGGSLGGGCERGRKERITSTRTSFERYEPSTGGRLERLTGGGVDGRAMGSRGSGFRGSSGFSGTRSLGVVGSERKVCGGANRCGSGGGGALRGTESTDKAPDSARFSRAGMSAIAGDAGGRSLVGRGVATGVRLPGLVDSRDGAAAGRADSAGGLLGDTLAGR